MCVWFFFLVSLFFPSLENTLNIELFSLRINPVIIPILRCIILKDGRLPVSLYFFFLFSFFFLLQKEQCYHAMYILSALKHKAILLFHCSSKIYISVFRNL